MNGKTTFTFGPVEVRNFLGSGETILTYPMANVRLKNGCDPVYFMTDHLGSVRRLINAAGASIEARTYAAFGTMRSNMLMLGAEEETKGWIGERYDEDAVLQYLNARYCDPKLGVFLQPDWF